MRLIFIAAMFASAAMAATDDSQFNGRWNILAAGSPRPRIWWLDLSGSGTSTAKARFLGYPVSQVEETRFSVLENEIRFGIERRPAARETKTPPKLLFYARLEDGKLKGTFEAEGDPSSYVEWTGTRAPVISDRDDISWKRGEAVVLFDGRDLLGWQPLTGKPPSGWSVQNGVLSNSTGAAFLMSEKKFWNFALHMEYRLAQRANSGVLLRGRYEVQIEDDYDRPPSLSSTGAIVGRLAPSMNAADLPNVWQSLDARLVGRQVTIALNEINVINRQTIEGPTSLAMDANEADPGPLLLQGDRGTIEIRKIIVYPLMKAR